MKKLQLNKSSTSQLKSTIHLIYYKNPQALLRRTLWIIFYSLQNQVYNKILFLGNRSKQTNQSPPPPIKSKTPSKAPSTPLLKCQAPVLQTLGLTPTGKENSQMFHYPQILERAVKRVVAAGYRETTKRDQSDTPVGQVQLQVMKIYLQYHKKVLHKRKEWQ